jgi:hypothetical protein
MSDTKHPVAPSDGRSAQARRFRRLVARRQRENIFEHVLKSAGRQRFGKITTANVMAGRCRRRRRNRSSYKHPVRSGDGAASR